MGTKKFLVLVTLVTAGCFKTASLPEEPPYVEVVTKFRSEAGAPTIVQGDPDLPALAQRR